MNFDENLMLKTITARHISMKTRKIKAYVWPTLLYGCETLTITTRTMTKLQSFEMWAYRKMVKISWREKKRNEVEVTEGDAADRTQWRWIIRCGNL